MSDLLVDSTIKIQFRQGTAAAWTKVNPILRYGESGFEIDTNLEKRGDGETLWNDLPYVDMNGERPMTAAAAIMTRDNLGKLGWSTNYVVESLLASSGFLVRNPDGTISWENVPTDSIAASYNNGGLPTDVTDVSY